MNFKLIILIVVVLVCVLYFILTNNKLIKLSNQVKEAFSTMDVYLKKRWDLIPNIVETVKGYAKHENSTLKEVVEARNKAVSATSVNEKVEANKELTGALNKLFALAESYPDLKANENFLSLQSDLKDTEDKITYARQFYNDSAMLFNNLAGMFPSNIVASIFNFKKFDYFKIDEEEKAVPKVEF